jgi:peptidoglycan hydrolase CwlO-like protein
MKPKTLIALATLGLVLIAPPARAQTTIPSPAPHHEAPQVTVEELKKNVDSLTNQVATAQQETAAAKQQRDEYSKAFLDLQIQASKLQAQLNAALQRIAELTPSPTPTPAKK